MTSRGYDHPRKEKSLEFSGVYLTSDSGTEKVNNDNNVGV